MKTCYDKNETMRLLGQQKINGVFWTNAKVRTQIQEIAEARPRSFVLDSAGDIFMLGFIYGKRAERAKRK